MIRIFCGGVGTGKSYHALVEGLAKVASVPTRYVVANFPIVARTKKQRDRWIYVDDDALSAELLIQIAVEKGFVGREGHALLIIDEAGVVFNCRDWAIDREKRLQWIKFFAQSRKFGYDVILVAQDPRSIDRQIRDLADVIVRHFRMNRAWLFAWVPVPVFGAVAQWARTSLKAGYPELILLKPWVARQYDTMRMFNVSDLVHFVTGRPGPGGRRGVPARAGVESKGGLN